MTEISSINKLLNEDEIKSITEAIKSIEKKTTGKIKIYIGDKTNGDSLENARDIFIKLGLRQLVDKNGVIFIITLKDKKFTVFGDDGINIKVSKIFWENIKNAVIEKFRKNEFFLGLMGAINIIGEKLSESFLREFENLTDEIDNDEKIIFEE